MCPRATWVPNLGHPLGLSPSEAPANPERQSAASLLPGEGSGPQLLEAGSPQLLSGEGKPRLGLAAVGQGQVSCCWGGWVAFIHFCFCSLREINEGCSCFHGRCSSWVPSAGAFHPHHEAVQFLLVGQRAMDMSLSLLKDVFCGSDGKMHAQNWHSQGFGCVAMWSCWRGGGQPALAVSAP